MKGKIIVLSLMLFIVTGCNATYKLEYFNDSFKETLIIDNVSGYEEEIKEFYNADISTNYDNVTDYSKKDGLLHGYTYYEKSLNENAGLSLKYFYNFDKEEYNHTFIGKNVYPNLNASDNSIYSGTSSDIFVRYPNLNNITIEFSTDKYIGYNNADNIENNTYYWYLTKENYQDKKIEVVFKDVDDMDIFEKVEKQAENLNEDEVNNYLKYVFIVLGIILFGLVLFVSIKFMNSNKK